MKRLSSLTKDKTNEFTAAGADLGASRIMRVLKCLDVMLDLITLLLKGRNKGKCLNGEGFVSWGCMHVFIYFFPLLHSHSAAFSNTAIHPAAELIRAVIIYSEAEIDNYCSFPTLRTPLPNKSLLTSPHLSGACSWRCHCPLGGTHPFGATSNLAPPAGSCRG